MTHNKNAEFKQATKNDNRITKVGVKEVVGFKGEFTFDSSKPDGTPRKLMDSSKLNNLGWKPTISLEDGIKSVYREQDKSDW